MSISRKELSSKLIHCLCDNFKISSRFLDFDISKVYFNYTDAEKEKSNKIISVLTNKIVANEFFICYTYNEDLYFLVCGDNDFSDENIVKVPSDIIDLFIICSENCIKIDRNVTSDEFYNIFYTYEVAEYSGLTYSDIIDFMEPFSLYKLDKDSVLSLKCDSCIYAYYRLCEARYNSFSWKNETLDEIENVIFCKSNNIPYHNVLFSLSSRQWHHIFLESYRMIEHLFSAVYLNDVSKETGISITKLSDVFENILNWRPPEEKAIERIFQEIETEFDTYDVYEKVIEIKRKNNPDEKLHKWYYKEIRNQIAHFRITHRNIEFTDEEWNELIQFNFLIIKYIYEKYDELLSF